MRIRTALVAATLLLPSAAFAQRLPRIGGGRPGQPVPPGKEPEVIARSQAYQRSRYTIETYPLLSRVTAPSLTPGSGTSTWMTFGGGTHLDYRYSQYLAWTADVTSAFLGGQASMETAELGIRFRPLDWEHKVRPYADVRGGYQHTDESYSSIGSGTEIGIGPASSLASTSRYSRGFGAVAGVGVDYSLTNTLGITTGVSAVRATMNPYSYNGTSLPTAGGSFQMTTYRLTLGLKYNPVHALKQQLTSEK